MQLAKPLIFLFFLLFFFIESFGQDPQYIQYGINDGLPSPELYHSVLDKDGNVIITSDRGIAKYNGYEFKTYSMEDGLLDNTNFRIIKHKEALWFLGYNGKITIWENGIFRPHPINSHTDTLVDFTWWEDIIFINETDYYLLENVAMYNIETHTIGLFKDGKFQFHSELPGFLPIKNEMYGRNELIGFPVGKEYLMGTHNKKLPTGEIISDKSSYVIEPAEKVFNDVFAFFLGSDFTIKKGQRSEWVSRLFFFKDQEVFHIFDNDKIIHAIFSIGDEALWACTESGLHKFWKEQESIEQKEYFKDFNISSVLMDREGGHWVTTLGDGLLYIPSFDIYSSVESVKEEKMGFVTALLVEGKQLYIGCKNGKLMKAENTSSEVQYIFTSSEILDLFYHNAIMTSSLDYIVEKDGQLSKGSNNYYGRISHIEKFGNTEFIWGGSRVVRFNKLSALEKEEIEPDNIIFTPFEITAIDALDSSKVYLGTVNGMLSIENLQLETPYFSDAFIDKRISDLIAINEKKFIVSTLGYGLTFINNNSYSVINKSDGISSDIINTCFLQNDSTLWVGTVNGLDKLKFEIDEGKVVIEKIHHYSNQDGLISNFVTEITLWDEHIVIGTDKGISYFDVNYIPPREYEGKVIVDSIYVNKNKETRANNFRLDSNENDITIYYGAIQYNKPRKTEFYNYRLNIEGANDTSWYTTDNRSITFPNLIPNKYKFEIYCSVHNNEQPGIIETVEFEITPPFTQTAWFKMLIAGLLGLGIWYFIKQRERRIFERNELQRIRQEHLLKLNNAQLTALRSQMNPHFIFNALNSIQNFVFKKDVRQANHFLTKFSNLIRQSLELSKLNVLPLVEELKFLKNYLELETMRFPDHFEYEFHLPENWEERAIEIPSLLIQPILENSIRHGFKGIDYKGKLDIFIDDQASGLKIVIEDNGIGLIASARLTSLKNHKSFAMNILENRIQMINELNGSEASYFTIKELENNKNGSQGVVVNLFIAKSKFND